MSQKVKVKNGEKHESEGKTTYWTLNGEDGFKASTFDSKIEEVNSGDLLSLDPTVNTKGNKTYINFEKWTVLEKNPNPPQRNGHKNGGETPEGRASMEAQVAVRCIMDLATPILTAGLKPPDRLAEALNKAFDWCESKITAEDSSVIAKGTGYKATTDKTRSNGKLAPPFANAGQCFTACLQNLGKSQSDVITILEVVGVKDIKDFDKAYADLVDKLQPDIPF